MNLLIANYDAESLKDAIIYFGINLMLYKNRIRIIVTNRLMSKMYYYDPNENMGCNLFALIECFKYINGKEKRDILHIDVCQNKACIISFKTLTFVSFVQFVVSCSNNKENVDISLLKKIDF